MHDREFHGCPYQCEDGYNDRNRFPHDHLFVGEIENGNRYPYDTYSKAEEDERFAVKQTEADLAALSDVVDTKASQAALDDLTDVVATKASEAECIDIRSRLDALEYVDIKINSITASPAVCELGSSTTINLAWSLNKAATQQNINGIPVTGNSKRFENVTTNTAFTLSVTDGHTNASKTASVTFANQIYYGAAASLSNVTSLSKVLSNNPARTLTVNAGTGEYIVYAIPSRLGDVVFYSGGFEGGFEDPVEQMLENESGYREMYKVYRSTNANLGETTIEVKEG